MNAFNKSFPLLLLCILAELLSDPFIILYHFLVLSEDWHSAFMIYYWHVKTPNYHSFTSN